MKKVKSKKEEKQEYQKKIHRILEHEREHREQREQMEVAKGGWTDDISDNSGIDTMNKSWKQKTGDMRERLRGKKAKARSLWAGR